MGNVKEIKIKNRKYYFSNDMINIKDFDSNLLRIDNKSYKNIGVCNIGYITIKKIDDFENIHSVNPLYLMIGKAIGHIERSSGEVKIENKYLIFDLTDGSKEVLKKIQRALGWN